MAGWTPHTKLRHLRIILSSWHCCNCIHLVREEAGSLPVAAGRRVLAQIPCLQDFPSTLCQDKAATPLWSTFRAECSQRSDALLPFYAVMVCEELSPYNQISRACYTSELQMIQRTLSTMLQAGTQLKQQILAICQPEKLVHPSVKTRRSCRQLHPSVHTELSSYSQHLHT